MSSWIPLGKHHKTSSLFWLLHNPALSELSVLPRPYCRFSLLRLWDNSWFPFPSFQTLQKYFTSTPTLCQLTSTTHMSLWNQRPNVISFIFPPPNPSLVYQLHLPSLITIKTVVPYHSPIPPLVPCLLSLLFCQWLGSVIPFYYISNSPFHIDQLISTQTCSAPF